MVATGDSVQDNGLSTGRERGLKVNTIVLIKCELVVSLYSYGTQQDKRIGAHRRRARRSRLWVEAARIADDRRNVRLQEYKPASNVPP